MNEADYPVARQRVNGILADFAQDIGLAGCCLDSMGQVRLALDDVRVELLLEEAAGTLVLLSPLGPVGCTVEAYSRLLELNLLWRATGGATLARDAGDGQIWLQLAVGVASLDYPRFCLVLRDFVNTCVGLERGADPVHSAASRG